MLLFPEEAFLRKRKMMSLIVMMLSTGQLDKKLPLFLTLILWNVLDQALWSLIIQNLQSQHLQCKNFPGNCFQHLWELGKNSRKPKAYCKPSP